ncbi:MAG: Ig-like domain-containing protein [Clostridia bacterium]|nr:Ig-like domain-containing protein [Clostridia bacterium]
MKRNVTRLMAVLLAALLLGTAGLAEADIVVEAADVEIELPGAQAPEALALDGAALEIDGAEVADVEGPAEDMTANAAVTKVTLGVGQKYKIDRKPLGSDLSFQSSKPRVAAVTAKGVVTAKRKGSAVVTCLSGKKVVGRWKVTVKAAPKKVSLNVKQLTMGRGEQVQLAAKTTKNTATRLTWQSSKKSVVAVSADGLVTARRKGTATVTVTTHNGRQASVEVTVKAAPRKVTLSADRLELKPGASKTLAATLPASAASWAMTWSSSDETVATVSAKGRVKAVAEGTATITATAFNGVSASCEVEVAEYFYIPIDKAHFPDDNFRAYVAMNFDPDGDMRLYRQEISAIKKIDLDFDDDETHDDGILTLKGIEYFTVLEELRCGNHALEEIDVSQNKALNYLSCVDNCIRTIDVTQNTELEFLDLTCTWDLECHLDLSNCPKLKVLACEESGLTGVTIANLPKLEVADFLWCDGITKLDISGCGKLKRLRVPGGDDFGDLDYLNIDGCVSLAEMHCVNNKLKTLDVSHCPALVACLEKGPADEGNIWIKYENGDDYLTIDKDIVLTPAPKA